MLKRISSSPLLPQLIAFLVLGLCSGCGSDDVEPREVADYSLAQLSADFEQFVDLIHEHHPMFFTDRTELERTISTQRELLREGMNDFEFYRILAPVAAAVRCGHARLNLSQGVRDYYYTHGNYLPLEIRAIDADLYVYRDLTPEQSIGAGSRILAIDGNQSADIIDRLEAGLPADGTNLTYKRQAINEAFSPRYRFFFDAGQTYSLQFLDPISGQSVEKSVSAISWAQWEAMRESRFPDEQPRKRLATSISSDGRYAVLQIGDFSYYHDPEEFNEPLRDFFALLYEEQIGALILDLRGNDGGDPHCSATVVEHLVGHPVQYFASGTRFYPQYVVPRPVPDQHFTGELFVLIDGRVFSSSGHLCALLKHHGVGTFIGTETGGSFACNDASEEYTLTHSGMTFGLPRMTFRVAATGLVKGRGILPDHEIQPTIEELIEGRDVVLEKAISLIGP